MGKKKEEVYEVNSMVNVTFGTWNFQGDYRLIPEIMGIVNNSVLPVFHKSNEDGVKLGVLPIVAVPKEVNEMEVQ